MPNTLWGRRLGILLALATPLFTAACATSPSAPRGRAPSPIEAVAVHPVFATWFLTTEHWEGQLDSLGDALGVDCIVAELLEEGGRTWLRTHRRDGARNEDWVGWRQEVLSPIAGDVVRINLNPTTNDPGSFEPGVATFVVLRDADGTHVLVAHLDDLRVVEGERVQAGQVIGLVGNNGNSRHPHVHLGAWRDGKPLQIRFDLREMAKLRR